ncbi:MAG: glycerate kinase [Proteobacteria bacterium]|nr:glycerate kinase [Pseudomonadota bacterium]
MNFRRFLGPLVGLVLIAAAYRAYGWGGVALVTGGLVMFLLLHLNRTMTVLRRAADRPIGSVASAVMLDSKLRKGVNVLHVIAMTRALGELRSPKDEQPETFRWTDAGGSYVDAEFYGGKLRSWSLTRPEQDQAGEAPVSSGVAE